MVAAASILETPPSIFSGPARDESSSTWLERWSREGWLSLQPEVDVACGLGDWLADCIEQHLSRLGAAARPEYVAATPHAILEDQIYRLKMLGFQGLAVLLPSLSAWAEAGVLCPRDSATLIDWCDAARRLRMPLRLSTSDASLQLYEAPVALTEVRRLDFPVVCEPELPEPAARPVEQPSAIASLEESEPIRRQSGIEQLLPAPPSVVSATSRRAAMKSLLADDDEDNHAAPANAALAIAAIGMPAFGETLGFDQRATDRFAARRLVLPEAAPAPDLATAAALAHSAAPEAQTFEPSADAEDTDAPHDDASGDGGGGAVMAEEAASTSESEALARHHADVEPAPRSELVVRHDATLSLDDDSYSQHIEGLQASGGSHGWEDIEALFEAHYLPLQKAVRDGSAPALAASVLAEWAKDFAESYEQAFEAIRSNRGKKPRLVLDVPTYAYALSRKHNAEHLKLVLVDALRADIGVIVRDKLRVQMANTAECVASGVLWSALPCNTAAQMELIARGSDGLRHFSGELTEAQLMSRGNDLRRLRPVRVGSHRMYKLDIVQYLARDAEKHSSDNLEQYAAEVATSVGRFLRQQEPGTLVYLFGDHGFGGSSNAAPEQVLTPYQAWQIAR